jgi:hypothetical protein
LGAACRPSPFVFGGQPATAKGAIDSGFLQRDPTYGSAGLAGKGTGRTSSGSHTGVVRALGRFEYVDVEAFDARIVRCDAALCLPITCPGM